MGNMIGILSTVILVSTLATLIFAVGAYTLARRRRRLRVDAAGPNADTTPEEPVPPLTHPIPPTASTTAPTTSATESGAGKPVFRRLTPRGEEPAAPDASPKSSGWEWE